MLLEIDMNKSPTILKYKENMSRFISLYYPNATHEQIDAALDYSIQKRMRNSRAKISNSYKRYKVLEKDPKTGTERLVYKNKEQDVTLQQISDYILSREPIVTAFGTMFAHHGEIPNPLCDVVQSFLDNRNKHKKQMFQYPKGSEYFEKYNLLQSLDKIDANGKLIAVQGGNVLDYDPDELLGSRKA